MEKENRIPDGLLTYKGRPSLFYPAIRAEQDQDEIAANGTFPRRLASGLGTAKFLCGACLALLGGMAVYVQVWSAWTYGGIWSGLFAIFTGLCIILTARKHKPKRKSLLVALLVLSILGFFNTGLLATFTAMGLVAEVYMEDVAGSLVWKGVENASPFVVQILLLATATADSLLSLACCVISGREVCCCGRPTPAVVSIQRRDRLIHWLGSQQDETVPPQHKILNLPTVKLVSSTGRHQQRGHSKTPSRIFPGDINESLPSSSGGGSANINLPLVKADELGKHSRKTAPRDDRSYSEKSKSISRGTVSDASDAVVLDDKYFALDKKLSEEFIDRTWNFR